ncbi:acyltransferase family protein [Pseudomonas alloputida]|uniref:acyltransferase family protein n=1 Tax=Pseudomonas TaxID=286 RepID=UPI003EEF4E23
MEKFYGIQYLRGTAASLVILYHSLVMFAVAPYFSKPIGDFGVDIFFVISGFVMWVTTEAGNKSIFRFWLSRFLRVAPLYWLFTLALVAAVVYMPSLFFNTRGVDLAFLAKSLLFIPALNPDVGDITPVYTVGWTLVYEMFFYALFGLTLWVARPALRVVMIALVLCSLVLSGVLLKPEGAVAITYTNPIILEFLFGVLVGYKRHYLLGLGKVMTTALISVSIAALLLADAGAVPRVLSYGVPALLLVCGVISLEKYLRAKVSKAALLLGEASYSMYLSHPMTQRVWYVLFVALFGQVASKELAIVYAVGALAVGLLGGVMCYVVVEKSLLKFAKAMTGNKSGPGVSLQAQR